MLLSTSLVQQITCPPQVPNFLYYSVHIDTVIFLFYSLTDVKYPGTFIYLVLVSAIQWLMKSTPPMFLYQAVSLQQASKFLILWEDHKTIEESIVNFINHCLFLVDDKIT